MARGAWLGDPEVLQRGVGAEDQYGVADLAVDRDGRVVVVVTTHRSPPQPPWPSGWSAGLMARARGARQWQGPHPIHTNRYGVWVNLQLHDGRAHASFRTSPGGSVIGYRSYELAAQRFVEPADVVVGGADEGRTVANASSLVVGPFGGRTVVYPSARERGEPDGRLLLAYADAGERAWRTGVLAEDPGLRSGNVPHEHVALVRGPGRQVIALYSKVAERHRVLYRRTVDGGHAMEAERVVATSALDGAFARVSAVRDGRLQSPVWALVAANNDDPAAGLGVRAVRAPGAAPPRWR